MTPLSVEDVRAVTIGDVVVTKPRVTSRELWATVDLHNGSSRWLTSPQGPHAFNLALRWVTDDLELRPDQPRTPLPRPVPPGRATTIQLLAPAPTEPGAHVLRVTAVAEGVAWRERLGGPGSHRDAVVRIDD